MVIAHDSVGNRSTQITNPLRLETGLRYTPLWVWKGGQQQLASIAGAAT